MEEKTDWDLGVAAESVKVMILLVPLNGYWSKLRGMPGEHSLHHLYSAPLPEGETPEGGGVCGL